MILTGTFPDRSYYRVYVPKKLREVINKGMHPDPNERFQRAEEFRYALEQVSIRATCAEGQVSQSSFEWESHAEEEKLRGSMSLEGQGKWREETACQKSHGAKPRRVGRLCLDNLTEGQARKTVHRITSRFVTEGSSNKLRA
jgi:hypothetical protein